MIPYDIDPSLHTGEPAPAILDDGFSPPLPHEPAAVAPAEPSEDGHVAPALWAKSPYQEIVMATHPVEPEHLPLDPEPAPLDPSQLPVEPDFGPMLPPGEPEDPGVKPPTI